MKLLEVWALNGNVNFKYQTRENSKFKLLTLGPEWRGPKPTTPNLSDSNNL